MFGTSDPLEIGFPLYELGNPKPVAYKYRKGGWVVGKKTVHYSKGSKRSLFGLHLALPGETYDVYICEGETDAMRLSQYEGLEPFALCLAYGGNPDRKADWVSILSTIVGDNTLYTSFDNDESGYKLRDELTAQWKGKIKHINLPLGVKDVCELLQLGRVPSWDAFQLPGNLLTGDDLTLTGDNHSRTFLSTGYEELDYIMGGYSPGEMMLLAGGPKNGKTTFLNQLVVKYLEQKHGKVLLLPLELSYQRTMQSLAAIKLNKLQTDCSDSELEVASRSMSDDLFVMRHFGFMTIKELENMLDLIPRLGVKLVVMDHITAAVTSFDSGLTTQLLDAMLSLIQSKINIYGVTAIVVSHVNRTDDEKLKISVKHLRGSNALAQIPASIWGITLIEEGVTRLHTLTVTRALGRSGEVVFDFDGQYEEQPKLGRGKF